MSIITGNKNINSFIPYSSNTLYKESNSSSVVPFLSLIGCLLKYIF